jgi:ATP phosphoribosyltransferase
MLRIAIQSKGRLYDDCMNLLKESGIKLGTAKRTLLIPSSNFPVEVLYLRDDDIPECVATGVADVGIVGLNEFREREKNADIVKGLGFSKCRLSLAIPQSVDYPGLSWFEGKKIATSYPNILTRFLEEKGIHADIHVITGSVEIAPNVGLGDAIFDIVSSGSTLVSNRLKEVEVVVESEAVLIATPGLDAEKQALLEQLMFRFDAVRQAEDKKYVMMNVPDGSLQSVLAMLPGVNSPTVIPLATQGWHSVHTVISERSFWDLVGKLKEAGAEGILALNIEKMVM